MSRLYATTTGCFTTRVSSQSARLGAEFEDRQSFISADIVFNVGRYTGGGVMGGFVCKELIVSGFATAVPPPSAQYAAAAYK